MAKKRNVKSTPVSKIRPGKLRHESLPPEQEELARQIYDACGHLVYPTFEQWELGLLRDTNPVQELVLWSIIATTFDRLSPIYPDEDQRQVLWQIVLRSMGETPTKYPEITEIYATVSLEIMG